MKKLLSLAVMAIGLAEAQAQDVKIEFITPSIVHVVKGQPTKTLVVTAKPQDVAVTKKGNTTSSKELTVKQDAKGNLTFLTAKGKVLLKEKECDVLEARQTFTLDKDEAIYGLGTIQNGKMNRRGEKKRMEQSNLEDFQNVLQSIKGYGIYWENYSPTLFEDNASGMTFDAEVGDGVDYYFMPTASLPRCATSQATSPCSPCGPTASGSPRSAIRVQPRPKVSLTSTVRSTCPSTVSSRTGSTGAPTICGMQWISLQKTSPTANR